MTFDIATVTFDLEYPMLELQAYSIEKYFNVDIGKIILINNGNDNIDHCKSWYGKFKDKVEIHHISDIVKNHVYYNYGNQMVAKIKLSNFSVSENILILDNKNWFINSITENKIFKKNKLAGGSGGIGKEWELQWKNSLEFFGLTINDHPYTRYSARTPFFVKTHTLQELQNSIDNIEPMILSGKHTEFSLINAYIIKKYHSWCNYFFDYDPECGIETGLWPGYRVDLSTVIDRLYGHDYNRQHRTLVTGVHRKVWNTLTSEEKNSLAEKWNSQGIFNYNAGLNLIQKMCNLNQ
jgi:hypothetical protein